MRSKPKSHGSPAHIIRTSGKPLSPSFYRILKKQPIARQQCRLAIGVFMEWIDERLDFDVWPLKPIPSSRGWMNRLFICRRVSARFLHGFCTVSNRAEGTFRCKIRQRVQKLPHQKSRCFAQKWRWLETSINWDEPAACSLNQWAQGSSPWRCTTTTKSELFSNRRRVRIFCFLWKTKRISCFPRKTS